MSSKKTLVVLAALAATFTAGVAQARGSDDVRWSVTIGTPAVVPVYAPAPVYVPGAVYAPGPAYLPGSGYARPSHAQPHRVAYGQPTRWDVDGDGIPNRHDRVYNPRWDIDGDGIPNRHDRVYNPRWDVDGDGIPNRHDRADNPRWDRDGDGVPNRRDPRPYRPYRGGWDR
jgi:hypothetical protein